MNAPCQSNRAWKGSSLVIRIATRRHRFEVTRLTSPPAPQVVFAEYIDMRQNLATPGALTAGECRVAGMASSALLSVLMGLVDVCT